MGGALSLFLVNRLNAGIQSISAIFERKALKIAERLPANSQTAASGNESGAEGDLVLRWLPRTASAGIEVKAADEAVPKTKRGQLDETAR